MTVSKRTRFEVLRRDGFTCRYCGAKAPDVQLQVDHVVPAALGGTDYPANLVTSCESCNCGKTSIVPGAELVEDVDRDAARWLLARERAMESRAAERATNRQRASKFLERWKTWDEECEYLPVNWSPIVIGWLAAGLSIEDLDEAVGIACGASEIPDRTVFRYMSGVVRRMLAELDEKTRAELERMDH